MCICLINEYNTVLFVFILVEVKVVFSVGKICWFQENINFGKK